MDLTQLANLGEFIGGIAVLVTLVYLMQVRQGYEFARAEAIQRAVNTRSAERKMRTDSSLSAVLAKAHSDQAARTHVFELGRVHQPPAGEERRNCPRGGRSARR